MSKDSKKPSKKATSQRRTRQAEEDNTREEYDEFPEGKDFDVDIEIDIDDDGDNDRQERYRRRTYRSNDIFGEQGIFGSDGPFGPGGPFGPAGPFGKSGVFGPGGLFAKSGNQRRRREGGGNNMRRRRMFGPGELRLVLLAMLAEEARHGYELIKALEEMTAGAYSPSPGTIYPTLQMLADEGAIAEEDSGDAKKLFKATDAGLAELEERSREIDELWERLGRKRENARPKGSAELFRAMGNLATVLKNKAANGGLKDMDKEQVVDLIDELARKIERL